MLCGVPPREDIILTTLSELVNYVHWVGSLVAPQNSNILTRHVEGSWYCGWPKSEPKIWIQQWTQYVPNVNMIPKIVDVIGPHQKMNHSKQSGHEGDRTILGKRLARRRRGSGSAPEDARDERARTRKIGPKNTFFSLKMNVSPKIFYMCNKIG